MIILDGPMGTELHARGVDTSLPLWSARALVHAPHVIAEIHRDYADAGATVHTTNTFRTRPRTLGDAWAKHAANAVAIARESVPSTHRVAGCIAPIEDCYRPDLSPGDRAERAHRELARVLAEAGANLLLCETFPHVGEAVAAVGAAVGTGVETWCALTAGPDAALMTPEEFAEGAMQVVDAGAKAVFINCTAATLALPYLDAIASLDVAKGVYANAGTADDEIGWTASPEPGAERYAALAQQWRDAGATLIGGCCGTTPAHIASLVEAFAE
ncbi:MAG: homocysteine S-methyltransferase family protein [Myxococcota bacterium]